MKNLIYIMFFILFVGCADNSNTPILSNEEKEIKQIDEDMQNKEVKAQIIDDEAKTRKLNLFNKCFYYESVDICKKILQSYKEECSEGIGLSCGLLSIAYKNGKSVEDNYKVSLGYAKLGCNFKDSLSCAYMRKHYLENGENQKANDIIKNMESSCASNSPLDCFLLSLIYENDASFAAQSSKVKSYREKACNNKLSIACAYLDSKKFSKKEYQEYQEKACNLGMLPACDALRELKELEIRTVHPRLYRVW